MMSIHRLVCRGVTVQGHHRDSCFLLLLGTVRLVSAVRQSLFLCAQPVAVSTAADNNTAPKNNEKEEELLTKQEAGSSRAVDSWRIVGLQPLGCCCRRRLPRW